jgi:hypothetical protein
MMNRGNKKMDALKVFVFCMSNTYSLHRLTLLLREQTTNFRFAHVTEECKTPLKKYFSLRCDRSVASRSSFSQGYPRVFYQM